MSHPASSLVPGRRPRQPRRLATWVRETLFRDVFIAALVGFIVGITSGFIVADKQAVLDDARADREIEAARQQAQEAITLENLRYVRDKSTAEPGTPKLFGALDLSGVPLDRLNLNEADFGASLFQESSFRGVQAARALFENVTFRSVDARRADFSGASFREALLECVDLRGTNMSNARFTGAILDKVVYNDLTSWPDDFQPPPSTPPEDCGFTPELSSQQPQRLEVPAEPGQ